MSNWTLVKTALLCNDTLSIEFTKVLENTGDDDVHEGLTGMKHILSYSQYLHNAPDSIRAISFKPDDDTVFLVGTDEGMVYLCTTQFSSELSSLS